MIPFLWGPLSSQIYKDRKQMVDSGARGGHEKWVFNYLLHFEKMGKFWIWMVGMAAQLCEHFFSFETKQKHFI